jgi:hypothetical protein
MRTVSTPGTLMVAASAARALNRRTVKSELIRIKKELLCFGLMFVD